MDIHFNHTEPVDAPAETLFEVITDCAGYPHFNPAVVKMTMVAKDENGAEFITKRKTRIAKGAVALRRARAGEGAIFTWVQIALANSSNATANCRLASSSAASS